MLDDVWDIDPLEIVDEPDPCEYGHRPAMDEDELVYCTRCGDELDPFELGSDDDSLLDILLKN